MMQGSTQWTRHVRHLVEIGLIQGPGICGPLEDWLRIASSPDDGRNPFGEGMVICGVGLMGGGRRCPYESPWQDSGEEAS